ncbi:hypothetical protein MKZ38_008074 [Zalerion maritima]|uniref:Uncharacterized protein n=1 Tax=Zalerion maritima TaxID=339359 RepID=A0AAD5WNT5_9PEZI|nr:hypothetical protein MKZ38_008074 [Zalerion maritima]
MNTEKEAFFQPIPRATSHPLPSCMPHAIASRNGNDHDDDDASRLAGKSDLYAWARRGNKAVFGFEACPPRKVRKELESVSQIPASGACLDLIKMSMQQVLFSRRPDSVELGNLIAGDDSA